MEIKMVQPPREFRVGAKQTITIKDCGHIKLSPNEQVTFKSDSKAEYDVVRKSWGYYATPSMNGRLKEFGLQAILVRGADGKFFLMLVEQGKEEEFNDYCNQENLTPLLSLDKEEHLRKLMQSLKA